MLPKRSKFGRFPHELTPSQLEYEIDNLRRSLSAAELKHAEAEQRFSALIGRIDRRLEAAQVTSGQRHSASFHHICGARWELELQGLGSSVGGLPHAQE